MLSLWVLDWQGVVFLNELLSRKLIGNTSFVYLFVCFSLGLLWVVDASLFVSLCCVLQMFPVLFLPCVHRISFTMCIVVLDGPFTLLGLINPDLKLLLRVLGCSIYLFLIQLVVKVASCTFLLELSIHVLHSVPCCLPLGGKWLGSIDRHNLSWNLLSTA